jgi:hypothetical protein
MLKRLTASGLLTRRPDPKHRQKGIFSLTEAAIQLVPLLAYMGAWGRRNTRPSKELSVRAELLEKGGAPLWNAFMDELRHLHLGAPRPLRTTKICACYGPSASRPHPEAPHVSDGPAHRLGTPAPAARIRSLISAAKRCCLCSG